MVVVVVCVWGGEQVGGVGVFLSPSCFSLNPLLGQLTQQVFNCSEEPVQLEALYGNLERIPFWFHQNNAE